MDRGDRGDRSNTGITADDACSSADADQPSQPTTPAKGLGEATPAGDGSEDDTIINTADRLDDGADGLGITASQGTPVKPDAVEELAMGPPSTTPAGKEIVGRGAAKRKKILEGAEDGGKDGPSAVGGAQTGRSRKQPKKTVTIAKDVVQEDDSDDDPSALSRKVKRLQQELDAAKEVIAQQKGKLQKAQRCLCQGRELICKNMVQIAKSDRNKARDSLFREAARLGRCQSVVPYGQHCTWEGGTEAEVIEHCKGSLREERSSIEALRRSLPRLPKAQATAARSSNADAEDGDNSKGDNSNTTEDGEDVTETRDVCSHRAECLKREEAALKEREQRLHMDRALHLKQRMLLNSEEQSNFRHYPFLQERYQLLNLIGKGGNSEVFEAFDLENMQPCAVKIHEIDRRMAEHQRQDFVRHALRESEIQKTLHHARIVRLLDCFAPSKDVFATVLELCKGDTLDAYMKKHGPLPEKDARSIIMQILSGLRYLNSCGRRIIHYDLKPGNVFFHCGQVKIADFGLSKVVEQPSCETIELTSKGAGTYWYLPPECCEGGGVPMISNKVDVWATGVIFYELLFSRRPFGHGQSQEAFIRSAGMEGTFEVVIPQTPKVSTEAKEFINRLLTQDRKIRPDVLQAAADPYLRRR